MALTGSQKAYLQARSAIARSGAIRSNYYWPFNAVITISQGTDAPVDVTPYVAYNGWSISMNINDELDTATLSLLPTLPFVPAPRMQLRIAFGSADNVQFGGLVMTVQRTRRAGPERRYFWDLTGIDWLAMFDARLVLAEYPAQSATTTILDIVKRFTGGGFTTDGVAENMPVIEGMTIVHERPSTILRRLTNLVGGGFYIDAARRVRAWSASIPSPYQEGNPQPLTESLASLKQFRMTEDGSQQRTRVLVEGKRTATLLGVPATALQASITIPIADASVVQLTGTGPTINDRYMRLGSQYVRSDFVYNPVADASKNPPATTTTVASIVGDGAIRVASATAFPQAGWVQVGEQIVSFSKASDTMLTCPVAPAYGAINAPIAVGTQVTVLATYGPYGYDRRTDANQYIWLEPAPLRAQPDDTPLVLLTMKQDQPAAEAIALRERSDGYYEHLVQDGRFSSEGAAARAAAELANFAQPLVTYEWETDDPNAEPGRMQDINFGLAPPIVATVRITNVEVRPLVATAPPRRVVRATAVQPASVLDVWIEDTR